MDAVAAHLVRHDFKALFVEVLGWDHAAAEHRFEADGLTFVFRLIAHKRGFQILVCETDRYTLFNRSRLRELERQVFRLAHEHIVIYTCNEPRKQVWQWAIHMPDGRRLRHREHPFFSESPPTTLASRLNGLRFTLDEEERVTLVDALDRARLALDTKAEQNFFVNHPKYAEKGDKLALAMVTGGVDDFHRFVLFHRRLARWGVKRLVRKFGMDEDDAEQIGMLAIIAAAKHFKPEMGFQFSTYAVRAIHQRCTQHGPDEALMIRISARAYWPLSKYLRTAQRLEPRCGQWAGERFLDWIARRRPLLGYTLRQFRRAVEIRTLSDPKEPEFRQARRLISDEESPEASLSHLDRIGLVHKALEGLPSRAVQIVKLRYGFDQPPETLETIAQRFGLTKERVRQIVLKTEAAMRPLILKMLGEPLDPPKAAGDAISAEEATNNNEPLNDEDAREVRSLLQSTGEIGAIELSANLRAPVQRRKAVLRRLVEAGEVEQVGVGRVAKYRLATPKIETPVPPPPGPEASAPQQSPAVFVLVSQPSRTQGELFAHAH